jgi:hypothetical protein
MILSRAYRVPLLAVMLLAPALAGQNAGRAAEPRPQAQARQAGRGNGAAKGQNAQARPANRPGEQILKLSRMTPEEREQALANLPPAQRAKIEEGLDNFQKLPPAAQERRLERLERLNSLPPQKQNQVRRSMKQLNELPEDRRMAINQELQHMSAMPDDERRAYMNKEEFRNRYTPAEQQIMGNLAEVLPARD